MKVLGLVSTVTRKRERETEADAILDFNDSTLQTVESEEISELVFVKSSHH